MIENPGLEALLMEMYDEEQAVRDEQQSEADKAERKRKAQEIINKMKGKRGK